MKKSFVILFVSSLLLVMSLGVIVFATGSEAGTSADPVVTKSYVDALYNKLSEKLSSASSSPASSESSSFVVVEVQAGQKVIGGEGTEMVLRGGSATAIDNGVDGISDLTTGKDLKSPTKIEKNHLLLVPRDDGRGISCSTHAYVMVKGGYTVE